MNHGMLSYVAEVGNMIDYLSGVNAANVRRDRMIDALNTIRAYCLEQVVDATAIHDINVACDDLRDAIVSTAELEVEEYANKYTADH